MTKKMRYTNTTLYHAVLANMCWDLRLDKLSKFSTKTIIATEGVESKHSTELKHQE